MVAGTVLGLAQQSRQRSVVRDLALFQGAIPLGLTFQSVLFRVAVGVRDIELGIAPTLNLNMVAGTVLAVAQQLR
jgi:hypothetical protein